MSDENEDRSKVDVLETPETETREEKASKELGDAIKSGYDPEDSSSNGLTGITREEIAKNFDKKYRPRLSLNKEETSEEEEPEEEEEETPPTSEEEDLSETAETQEDEVPPKKAKKPKKVEEVEITVDGRTRMVDKAKVDAQGGVDNYQRLVASQERMRQAAEERKVLEAEKLAFQAEREKFEKSKTPPPPTDESHSKTDLPPSDDRTRDARRDKIVKALDTAIDGDTEAAADELLSATESERPKPQAPVDTKEIIKTVKAEVTYSMEQEQRVRALTEARANFAIDFPELSEEADADLFFMADRRADKIAKENPAWSYDQILHKAGEEVLEREGIRLAAAESSTSRSDKVAEKRTMQKPRAGSGKSPKKPEPKTPTKSEYIAEIQRRRGQTV